MKGKGKASSTPLYGAPRIPTTYTLLKFPTRAGPCARSPVTSLPCKLHPCPTPRYSHKQRAQWGGSLGSGTWVSPWTAWPEVFSRPSKHAPPLLPGRGVRLFHLAQEGLGTQRSPSPSLWIPSTTKSLDNILTGSSAVYSFGAMFMHELPGFQSWLCHFLVV